MDELFLSLDERIDQLSKMTYTEIYREMDQIIEEYPTKEVYSRLIESLSAFSTKLRRAAIFGLAKIGSEEAAVQLMFQLRSSKKGIRIEAKKALGKIGGQQVVQVLIRGMSYKDWFARETAAKALAELGTLEALPTLINVIFNDRSDKVRKAASVAIKKILQRDGSGDLVKNLDEFLEPYRNKPGYKGFKLLEAKLVLETCDNLISNIN